MKLRDWLANHLMYWYSVPSEEGKNAGVRFLVADQIIAKLQDEGYRKYSKDPFNPYASYPISGEDEVT